MCRRMFLAYGQFVFLFLIVKIIFKKINKIDKFSNLASHAVVSAVKRSPVPTKAAGNLGIKTWGKGISGLEAFRDTRTMALQFLTLTLVPVLLQLANPTRWSLLPSSVL